MSWVTCTRCRLSGIRRKIVLGRGDTPAEILIVGIAPGRTEDLMGQPFIGPSGKLLTKILADAFGVAGIGGDPRFFITNMVACRPSDSPHGANRDPSEEEIWACRPRVNNVYSMVRPRVVVTLGRIVERYYGRVWPNTYCCEHPAFLLRNGGVKSPYYLTYVRKLGEALSCMVR